MGLPLGLNRCTRFRIVKNTILNSKYNMYMYLPNIHSLMRVLGGLLAQWVERLPADLAIPSLIPAGCKKTLHVTVNGSIAHSLS